jgi:single-stranded DNA-binding protein
MGTPTGWLHETLARLASRKTPTSCRFFLGADSHKAKVWGRQLVFIGDFLSPGDAALSNVRLQNR